MFRPKKMTCPEKNTDVTEDARRLVCRALRRVVCVVGGTFSRQQRGAFDCFLQPHATLSYNTIPADGCQSVMRFDLAAIVLVLAWVFNVHATPVDITMAWNGHDQVDTAAIQPAVDADDSMQLQAMAIAELLRTATLNDFDELIGKDDTVYLSHDISNIHLSSLDQGRATASIAHEVTLPSSGSNYDYYYYYLAFVPLGVVGFTILQGWRTWQKERRVDRQAARRGRPFEVATS